ncbi:MAG TPA: hypothetical protein VN540_07855 [Clostridia bacterium]|nr:hypothetical protein [Clostridia bacterium]
MKDILISAPIIFLLFALMIALFSRLLGRKADATPGGAHELDPYACGQDEKTVQHFVSPSYYKLFSYAFFFTVMHVLVMTVATAPAGHTLLPLAYIGAGVLAMLILFRR